MILKIFKDLKEDVEKGNRVMCEQDGDTKKKRQKPKQKKKRKKPKQKLK